GLFFYTKIGSIISIGDLPTTNIIEPIKFVRRGIPSFLMSKIANRGRTPCIPVKVLQKLDFMVE
nr:hypothetical protein [Streptococcus sp. 11-4097]